MGRFASQLLTASKPRSARSVVERIVAVQAQDPIGARLAIRARTTGVRSSDVDAALNGGELVVTTLNRGTLHLVTAEDYWWLHQLTTPQLRTSSTTRLGQEGVSPDQADRAMAIIRAALADGPMVRHDLRALLQSQGIPTDGQAFIHLIYRASIDGLIVRGPMLGAEQGFVLVHDWLGPAPRPLDEDAALTVLASRYCAGHAPAEPADLQKWAGITLGQAQRAFASVRPPAARRETVPAPTLLGQFDPLQLGWASREWIGGGHQRLMTSNGIIRPLILIDGRAVGTWRLSKSGVELEFFDDTEPPPHLLDTAPAADLPADLPVDLGADLQSHLAAEARAVETFLST